MLTKGAWNVIQTLAAGNQTLTLRNNIKTGKKSTPLFYRAVSKKNKNTTKQNKHLWHTEFLTWLAFLCLLFFLFFCYFFGRTKCVFVWGRVSVCTVLKLLLKVDIVKGRSRPASLLKDHLQGLIKNTGSYQSMQKTKHLHALRRHQGNKTDPTGVPTLNVSMVFYTLLGLPTLNVSIVFCTLWGDIRVTTLIPWEGPSATSHCILHAF